jgi:hypothetical protein
VRVTVWATPSFEVQEAEPLESTAIAGVAVVTEERDQRADQQY